MRLRWKVGDIASAVGFFDRRCSSTRCVHLLSELGSATCRMARLLSLILRALSVGVVYATRGQSWRRGSRSGLLSTFTWNPPTCTWTRTMLLATNSTIANYGSARAHSEREGASTFNRHRELGRTSLMYRLVEEATDSAFHPKGGTLDGKKTP